MNIDRHVGLFNAYEFAHPIHLFGCGGSGSAIAHGLIRLGVGVRSPLHLHDGDHYEAHNVANQMIPQFVAGPGLEPGSGGYEPPEVPLL